MLFYTMALSWITFQEADRYRPEFPSAERWVQNVQQTLQVPSGVHNVPYKAHKNPVESGVQHFPVVIVTSRPFQLHLALIFKMYSLSIQNLIVHFRKTDMIFPFHYDW